MNFESIPKVYAKRSFDYYIDDQDKFYRFVDEFNIVGVHWSQPSTMSASYFLRVLQEGASARAHGYGKSYRNGNDGSSFELNEFYTPLLDHGALWKLNNGSVVCTATPYGTKDTINNSFLKMINQFDHFDSIRLQFLDDRYRFKSTGDYLIVIYYDPSDEIFDPFCSDMELKRKAIQH